MNEVEQIIKPATGIVGRPLVQFGLHLPYPRPRLVEVWPRLTGIHQRLQLLQFLPCLNPLGPFAMWPAFPASDYYGPAAPPQGRRRTTRSPAVSCLAGRPRTGTRGWFPRSPQTARRVRCPAMPLRHRHGYAAGLHRGLPTSVTKPAKEFPARHNGQVRTAIQPISTGFELAALLRGFTPLVPHVHLLVSLAEPAPSGSTGASRRCRGRLPPSPASPGSGCPQLHRPAATGRRWRSLTPTRFLAPRGAR